MKKPGIKSLFFLLVPLSLAGQSIEPIHYIKLTVAMGETLEVAASTIQIDTLIMEDDSRIVFLAPKTNLVVKNAYIGNSCTWDTSGQDGQRRRMSKSQYPSTGQSGFEPRYSYKSSDPLKLSHGKDGRDIVAIVNFCFLSRLTVDTSGGYGNMGKRGLAGYQGRSASFANQAGMRGGDGGSGYDGGNGGALSLFYSCKGFVPVFNEQNFRAIYLKSEGGSGGAGGEGGKGGKGGIPVRTIDFPNKVVEWEGQQGLDGPYGLRGTPGGDGKAGVLTLTKIN
ncbi:MAG: hypothetical protein SH819_05590 [Cytophagales bacterium]|nr:hypothetical protein [Cytophagales bacterium]